MKTPLFLASAFLLLALSCCPLLSGGTSSTELAVMSFNIRYGTAADGENAWPNRRELVFGTIRDEAPDLLGLQEALRFQLDELAAAFPEYAELGEGRDGGEEGEYSAILYRRARFEALEAGTFWLSDTPEFPSVTWGNACVRVCSWARLRERTSGAEFRFFNTHLDHESQPSREKSARLIAARMTELGGGGPAVLTGDFNAGEDSPSYCFLTGSDGEPASPRLVDAFRARHPEAAADGTFNGFRGERNGAKIDHVLVTPQFAVADAAIVRPAPGERCPSDHFPVTARLRLAR